MNKFGGDWTKKKIEILVEYAKAYLKIMAKYPHFHLLYFDGFAGSGIIVKDKNIDIQLTIGAARRIVELDNPKQFDTYYFVEKVKKNADLLEKFTKYEFPQKNILIVSEDCNLKLVDMAKYLKSPKGKDTKVLAYIDPCGMQLEWSSLQSLKSLNVDMWVLVPTGLGVNRLLNKNGNISTGWLKRLVKFLGMSEVEIKRYFYFTESIETLFGKEIHESKVKNAIEKSAILYRDRLNEIFSFVTLPFVLRNTKGTIMYHLFLASNNKTATKIGNDIIKKFNRIN
ncbi:MAG: three-Cys-motif partner protein TcmP [Melioribacteraceae bacterium]